MSGWGSAEAEGYGAIRRITRSGHLRYQLHLCAQKLIACADDQQTKRNEQLSFRTTELAVSVIQCNDASARRLLLGQYPRMRLLEFLEEAIITVIEEAIGPPRLPPPFADPWDVREAGDRLRTAMAEGFPASSSNQLETRGFAR
jgi:hypothetical protein